MQEQAIPPENNNLLFRIAANIRDTIGRCVANILPNKIEAVGVAQRPSAVVLLNAHGNYPYGLFDMVLENKPYTRQVKADSYNEYSIETHIKKLVDEDSEDSELYKYIISTLFQNVKYTSSVPAPYCGMMVGKIESKEEDSNEQKMINEKSSREQEYEIVGGIASKFQQDNPADDVAVLKLFDEMRHALRANANIKYLTKPEEFSEDESLKDFLMYINKMIKDDTLYSSYPLCPIQLDKRYVFHGGDDEEDYFYPEYGFHIWIGDEKYNLLNIEDYDRIQGNVIANIQDETHQTFANYVLNDIIKKGMIDENPSLRLSEISLFLWSLDLKDIIISDSACSIVLDMQGSDIITKDNFKNTIGRLYKTVIPQAEESQLSQQSPVRPVKAASRKVQKRKLGGKKTKRTKRTKRTRRNKKQKQD